MWVSKRIGRIKFFIRTSSEEALTKVKGTERVNMILKRKEKWMRCNKVERYTNTTVLEDIIEQEEEENI